MIWVTWRQQRLEAMIGGAVLALLAVFLLTTGLDMASTYTSLGVGACLASHAPACGNVIDAFRQQFSTLNNVVVWFEAVPLVFGVLLAAPLVLELEQGTYRLAWTQSITRLRWITSKVGVIVAAAIVVAIAFTALMTWWRAPLDQLDGRFLPTGFDFEGIVPLAYAVFAVALGLAVGTLLRRAVPAIAISLVGFFVVRLVIEFWARPRYMPALVATLTTGGPGRSSWVYGQSFGDRSGHQLSFFDVLRTCGVTHGQQVGILQSCLVRHGIVNIVTYQPGDRYWIFQGIETAIFLGLAAGLLALTVWWMRRRVV